MGFSIALLKCDKNCTVPQQVPMCFLCLIQDCHIKVTLKLSFSRRISPRTALSLPIKTRRFSFKHARRLIPPQLPSAGCHDSRVRHGRRPQEQSLRKTGSFPELSEAGSLDSCHSCRAGERLSAARTALPAPPALPCVPPEAKRQGTTSGQQRLH